MKQDTKNPFADFMYDQIVNISKAGAYDALSVSYSDLKERYTNVRGALSHVLKTIAEMDSKKVVESPATLVEEISKICSEALTINRPA